MRFPTKIPTLLGIILVIGVVFGVSIAFEQFVRTGTRASASATPVNVQFTNITDSSFTVLWRTPQAATGAIKVSGEQKENSIAYEDRDASAKLNKYTTHSITVRNVLPNSQYEVTILSSGVEYKDNGNPYAVFTAPPQPEGVTGLDPAHGTVTTVDNKPAAGALLFLTVEGGQTLSTVVSPTGSWLIPLSTVRSQDLRSMLPPPEDRYTQSLVVQLDELEATAISDTKNDSPVPTMILGKTYDFRGQQAKAAQPPVAAVQEATAVLGEQKTQSAISYKVALTTPANNAALPTNLPRVQGTAIPGKTVTVTLGITQPTSGTTTVGADGIFRFTPKKPLGIGKQSVTITTVDISGKPVAITHLFEVLKSGTQVLGDATPSATLIPTPTLEASPTPTLVATLEGEPLPTSGSVLPTILLLLLGAGFVASGIVLIKR